MSLILLSGSNLCASSGEHARWGCLVTNTHATAGRVIPEVRQSLQAHHDALRAAMRAALESAREHGQLRPGLDVEAGAETLALLAYGVNLRSRAGAEAADLLTGVRAVLDGFTTTTTEER
jgi:TetR/AcrR family transcriptional repressor of nem operon